MSLFQKVYKTCKMDILSRFFLLSQMRLKKTHRRQRLFQSSAQMCNWANGKIALKN